VIALHPEPTSAAVVQLLMLLRSTSSNERIYVEECDLSSIDSIKCFIQKWQKDAKSGMVQDLEARIDGIIFCDGDGAGDEGIGYDVGVSKVTQVGTEESMEKRHGTHLVGRHALVQLLLPTLLRSASTATSPIRIINQVSPFYSAVVPSTFQPLDLDYSTRPFPRKAPWIAEGQVALASVLLWREFQSRLEQTSSTSTTDKTGQATTSKTVPSDAVPTSSPILALSVCPGLTRSYIRQTLRASTTHPHFSPIGLAIYLLILPFIWLFAKSASEGAQVVLGALMADTVAEGERGKKKKKRVKSPEGIEIEDEEEKGKRGERRMWVRGGALYREGLVVRYVISLSTSYILLQSLIREMRIAYRYSINCLRQPRTNCGKRNRRGWKGYSQRQSRSRKRRRRSKNEQGIERENRRDRKEIKARNQVLPASISLL